MRRLERILLSKVPVWIVVVLLTFAVAGAVVFGGIVKYATKHPGGGLGHIGGVALKVAGIPKTLYELLADPELGMAFEQRFDGQTGLEFADPTHFSEEEREERYLFLARYVPKESTGIYEHIRWKSVFELIDLSGRKIVHVWQSTQTRGTSPPNAYPLPDGSLIVIESAEVVTRLDACSNNVEWRKPLRAHHSLERDADGNFWAPFNIVPPTVPGVSRNFEDHGLLNFSPSGEVLLRIPLWEALVRGGYRHVLYAMNHYERDPLHVNDVQPVLRDGPFWRRGDLFVSLRTNSVVLLYRPATDEVIWLRSGPWLHQHDVDIVGESEISVFSNNTVTLPSGWDQVLGANEVYIYDFATGEARSPWREAMRRHDVRTATMGTATVLGDGGLIVQEHEYGRLLRLSADGAVRWSYVNRASDGQVYRAGWSRYLDAEYGAEVARSLAACAGSGPRASATH